MRPHFGLIRTTTREEAEGGAPAKIQSFVIEGRGKVIDMQLEVLVGGSSQGLEPSPNTGRKVLRLRAKPVNNGNSLGLGRLEARLGFQMRADWAWWHHMAVGMGGDFTD